MLVNVPRGAAAHPVARAGEDGGGRPRLSPDVQVVVALSSLVAMLVVAVVIGMLLVSRVGGDALSTAERQLQFAMSVDDAALNGKAIANDQRGFVISGSEEFLAQIEVRARLAREAFAAAAQAADSAQRRALDEARTGFERWLIALDSDVAAYRSGDRAGPEPSSIGSTGNLRSAYESSLAEAQALAEHGVASATSAVSDASTRSVAILLAYLIVAVTIGLHVTIWTLRTILQPSYSLLRILRDADELKGAA
jgi:methyl-accepting chemotaxis protein